jgi:hypothetical protein
MGVLKKYIGNIKGVRLDMKFYFWAIGDTKNYILDVVCNTIEKNIYFFELGVVGKHNVKNVGGCWKGPKKKFMKNEGHQKKPHGCQRC